jgi:uncharacterized membrane protein YhdT
VHHQDTQNNTDVADLPREFDIAVIIVIVISIIIIIIISITINDCELEPRLFISEFVIGR